MLNKIM